MSVIGRAGASITTLQIEFQRTLRIPDDGKIYPLALAVSRFATQTITRTLFPRHGRNAVVC